MSTAATATQLLCQGFPVLAGDKSPAAGAQPGPSVLQGPPVEDLSHGHAVNPVASENVRPVWARPPRATVSKPGPRGGTGGVCQPHVLGMGRCVAGDWLK